MSECQRVKNSDFPPWSKWHFQNQDNNQELVGNDLVQVFQTMYDISHITTEDIEIVSIGHWKWANPAELVYPTN